MYLVISNDPKKIDLHDINDRIYYKQKKTYSDADYNRSRVLQKEIQKGNIIILQKIEEKDGNFSIPSPGVIPNSVSKVPSSDQRVDILLEKIKNLEELLKDSKNVPSVSSNEDITSLSKKIEDVEQQLKQGAGIGGLLEAIKALEQKVEGSIKSDVLLEKLNSILERAPGQSTFVSQKEVQDVKPEDIYVPNVTVEDGNSHIKLSMRTVEKPDNVQDALKKLREMKNKKAGG